MVIWEILARFGAAYTEGMTVAALIVAEQEPLSRVALDRLVEAAWSGGANPVLVSGLPDGAKLPELAQAVSTSDLDAAGNEAQRTVAATSAIIRLPLSHAGIDPETITALITAHGRMPQARLAATYNTVRGPIRLTPLSGPAASERPDEPVDVDCGDEAAVVASDGRAPLNYDAPPASHGTVDPWEQRGDAASERD